MIIKQGPNKRACVCVGGGVGGLKNPFMQSTNGQKTKENKRTQLFAMKK